MLQGLNYLNNSMTMNFKLRLLLPALLGFTIACTGRHNQDVAQDHPFSVTDTMMKRITIDTVKKQQVRGTITLNAKISAEEDKYVEIFPMVGGNVTSVNVESGDYVKKGDVLAVIHSGEVADMERQLTEAQGDVAQATKNLEVQQDLYTAKLSSERDLLGAQKELQKVQANLTKTEEMFKIYSTGRKSDYLVTAPISGFVTDKKISHDMLLRSDNAQNIFTIAQIDEVWVVANVYESDISRISEGMDAEIRTLSYPDKLFKGKVDKIFNILDPQTKTLRIRIRLPNPGFILKPEMVATVTLYYLENPFYAAVPSSSVIFDRSKNFVMVFHDRSHVETREITIYRSTDDHTYISAGLLEGERIISKNQLYIYDELND